MCVFFFTFLFAIRAKPNCVNLWLTTSQIQKLLGFPLVLPANTLIMWANQVDFLCHFVYLNFGSSHKPHCKATNIYLFSYCDRIFSVVCVCASVVRNRYKYWKGWKLVCPSKVLRSKFHLVVDKQIDQSYRTVSIRLLISRVENVPDLRILFGSMKIDRNRSFQQNGKLKFNA